MDGYKLSQLRKKLEALNYKQPLETVSAALVDKLVTDLLHTTDSYRDLKLQVAKKSQDIEDNQHKVPPAGSQASAKRLGSLNVFLFMACR